MLEHVACVAGPSCWLCFPVARVLFSFGRLNVDSIRVTTGRRLGGTLALFPVRASDRTRRLSKLKKDDFLSLCGNTKEVGKWTFYLRVKWGKR